MSDDVLMREEVWDIKHAIRGHIGEGNQELQDMGCSCHDALLRLLSSHAALRSENEALREVVRDALEHHEAQSRLFRDGWSQTGEDALKADYHAERAEVFRELLEAHREGVEP